MSVNNAQFDRWLTVWWISRNCTGLFCFLRMAIWPAVIDSSVANALICFYFCERPFDRWLTVWRISRCFVYDFANRQLTRDWPFGDCRADLFMILWTAIWPVIDRLVDFALICFYFCERPFDRWLTVWWLSRWFVFTFANGHLTGDWPFCGYRTDLFTILRTATWPMIDRLVSITLIS